MVVGSATLVVVIIGANRTDLGHAPSQAVPQTSAGSISKRPARVRSRRPFAFQYVPVALADKFAKTLIGLQLNEAERQTRDRALELRVIWRDGRGVSSTSDLQPRRINVAVRDNIVVRIDGLY